MSTFASIEALEDAITPSGDNMTVQGTLGVTGNTTLSGTGLTTGVHTFTARTSHTGGADMTTDGINNTGAIAGATTLAMTGALSGATTGGFSGLVTVGSVADANGTRYGVHKQELTIGHADLTAAATNESIDFAAACPAGSWFIGAYIDIDTLFSGGSVSDLDVDVGISGGDTNYLLQDLPAFTADPTGVITVGATVGPAFAATDSNAAKGYNDGAVTIAVDVKATGDNVVNLTAGDVNIVILYATALQTS